jgi:hypothetical protein
MFYYTAFGLTIASEFEFPELIINDQQVNIDVRIQIGTTPKSIEGATLCGHNLWVSPTQCLQQIEEVAYYYAENGNLVVVEPYANADQKSMRIYFLCSTMAAIIHQRKLIPLHASGIRTDKGVALIIGDSGAGKSTTIKALTNRGHKIFTDDVCVLRSNEGKIMGTPSYPVMKLWENSFDLLQLGKINEEQRLWPDTNKYGVFFHDQFAVQWEPVVKVFILEKVGNERVRMEKQKGAKAFVAIGSNTYRGAYIEAMQLNILHFTIVNDLVKQSEVYQITRPAEGDSLSEVISIIEKALK